MATRTSYSPFFHCSVDVKYYVGVVVDSVSIVMGREGVRCVNGGGGGGRRLRSSSRDILLGGFRRKRLHLGRYGGVVVIVVDGSVVGGGGGGGNVFGGVGIVVNALFVIGDFLIQRKGRQRGKEATR